MRIYRREREKIRIVRSMRKWKRVLAFMMVIVLGISAPQIPAGKVFALEETISYQDRWWDEAASVLMTGTGAVSQYTELTQGMYSWEEGWYVVKNDVTLEEKVVVSGNVSLILMDNTTLTTCRGIEVNSGNALSVYAQSEGEKMGKLVATCGDNEDNESGQAGIGGSNSNSSGEIVIYGGDITAHGGWGAAGIGGGKRGRGGEITIHGGKIEAMGGTDFTDTGAGIGGGSWGASGNITINGGQIRVTPVDYNAEGGAGIGGGYSAAAETILIRGGSINTTGGWGAAGIGSGAYRSGGEINIHGGEIISQGGYSAAGIGQGGYSTDTTGVVNIHGGNITSTGGSFAAGIGHGRGAVGKVMIHGGLIKAVGGNSGAGIGGGEGTSGGEIIISGGTVTATSGGTYGAGIGGGYRGAGGNIVISGGRIIATGKEGGAGIGGGDEAAGGEIFISGGTIEAIGYDEEDYTGGAGIGGGHSGNGASLVITGGNIKATAPGGWDGIGAGAGGTSYGTITDEEGNDLVLHTITLCGVENEVPLSKISGNGEYGIKDVVTLDNNKLYLYLSEEGEIDHILADSKEFRGALVLQPESGNKEGIYHNYTYTKQQETILAECLTEGCIQSVSVTIAPPQQTVFTGSPVEAVATVIPANMMTAAISYEALEGALTEGMPINCGSYQAAISLGEVEISTSYTISKKIPTKEDFVYTDPKNLRYDGKQKIPEITGLYPGMGELVISYYNVYDSNKTSIEAPVNVGLYGVRINTKEGDNYKAASNLESNGWRFRIDEAILDSSYFTYTKPDSLVYNESAKEAGVRAAEGIEGLGDITLSYYRIKDGTEEEAVPVNVGTYKVKIHVAEGNNNNATQELITDESWTFTIEPAETRITGVTGKRDHETDNRIYNTTTPEEILLTGTAVSGEKQVTGTFKLSDQVTELKKGDHGYPCVFVPDDTNYASCEGTVILSVMANEVEHITITKQPDKMSYIYGDKFDLTGAIVMAAYKDGSILQVTDKVSWRDEILQPMQTELELSYTFEGKKVTAVVEGISVRYLDNPTEILYNLGEKKEWYSNADGEVIVSAHGYTVSDSLSGSYASGYTLSYTQDGISSQRLYFKNNLGQMTDGVEVWVQYDRSAPVFPTGMGIVIKENNWNTLQKSIAYDLSYNDQEIRVEAEAQDVGGSGIAAYHYYVDTTGGSEVLSSEELESKTFITSTSSAIGSISEENTYVYYVYATDKAGNKSGYISSDGIRIDRTKPVITEIQIPEDTLLDISAAIDVVAGDEAGEVKEYYLICSNSDLTGVVNEENINTYTGVVKQTSGNFVINRLSANTRYYCIVGVRDAAGNINCSSETFTTKKTMPLFEPEDIPTLEGIYGQALGEMHLSSTHTTSRNNISGSWSISEENKTTVFPTVGTDTAYEITFTPDNGNVYSPYMIHIRPQVSKKQVRVSSVTAVDRVYEAENDKVEVEIILEGIRQTDQVILSDAENILGVLNSRNAGIYTTVHLPLMVLSGEGKENYEIVQPQGEVELARPVEIHKAEASIMVDRDSYHKIFGDDQFVLQVTDNNPEAEVEYQVISGADVIAVNKGQVTILKAGSAVIQAKLLETTNYKEGVSKTLTVEVEKKDGYMVDSIKRTYLYVRENEESINLKELLPSDCGAVEFSVPEINGDILYEGNPEISDGVLTYTVARGNVDDRGTIALTAVTDNYADMPIEIHIKLADRIPVRLKEGTEVEVNKEFLTYGESLETMDFKEAIFVDADGNKVQGRLEWKTPKAIPQAGEYQGEWIFTPSDTAAYLSVEGILTVSVNKAKPVVLLEEGKDAYCKKFTDRDFKLEGITVSGNGVLTYTVSEGKTLAGDEKNPLDILTVSADGIVSLHGTGVVTIAVTTTETDNYLPAQQGNIRIEVIYADEFLVEELEELVYTGKAQKPQIRVLDGISETVMQAGKDYTISYKNNTKAYILKPGQEGFDESKAPCVVVKGKGNYKSQMKVYFTILPKDISTMEDESIVAKEILLEENGRVQRKVPSLTYYKKKLSGVLKPEDGTQPVRLRDFIYSYPQLTDKDLQNSAYKDIGTWKILVEGTGNYTGSRYIDLIIASKGGKISSVKIGKLPVMEYNNGKPIVLDDTQLIVTGRIQGKTTTLIKDTHYSVDYRNNTEIGTATVTIKGIPEGGFFGTKTAAFKIQGTSIGKATVTGIESRVYNGKEQLQELTITVNKRAADRNGIKEELVTLTENDYEVIYDNHTEVGTAKITIKGKGAYTGTIKKSFKITAYDISGETDAEGNTKQNSILTESNGLFAKKEGELAVKYVKGGARPEIKLSFDGKELKEGKDFTVTYKNNRNIYTLTKGMVNYKASKAPAIVIKGKGNFSGTIRKTFVITGRSLQDSQVAVTMNAEDRAASTKRGGYISKPVLVDKDQGVLKQGKDYTAPVYTICDENGKVITLNNKDVVNVVGTRITVTVKGMGAYAGEEPMSTSYVITEKSFTNVKVKKLQKDYTGRKVLLTKEDFYYEDGTSKVVLKEGRKEIQLHYGIDFEVVPGSYKNNLGKGTAQVTLRGISENGGLYGGTKNVKFTIGSRGLKDWLPWLFL